MQTLDWIMIGGYFAMLIGVAAYATHRRQRTSEDYFLAGRHLGWFIVGASIFASNIGSEHLVGLAGSGTTDGVAMAHYELHAWCLLILGWVFVPFFMRSKVFTMPEFLERRFSPNSRWVLSIISLVAYVVTKIAVGIFAGGIVFEVLLPDINFLGMDSFWLGSILVLVFTGLYTTLGGFRAVAYTEALQTIILIAGSALVTYYGLAALGGWSELRATVGSDMFNLWKPLVPEGVEGTWAPVEESSKVTEYGIETTRITRQAWYFNGNFPWLGMLICAPIIGLWYWCTDQYIVQRALGAPNEQQARRGSVFAGMLKLLPVFIFIIPGMICIALTIKAQTGNIEGMNFDKMFKTGRVVMPAEIMAMDAYRPYVVEVEETKGDPTPVVKKIDLDKMAAESPETLEQVRRDQFFVPFKDYFSTDGQRIDLEKLRADDPDGEKMAYLLQLAQGSLSDSGKGMSFPMMVTNVLPTGVRGVVVAGLLAALMSSLAGVFNACSTLFTIDFYRKLKPQTSEAGLVRIGRIATFVMVCIGLGWIPVIQGSEGLYYYLQSVQGYLAPPIFVVFFLGVFWKRLNGPGCLAVLIVGFLMGLFRMAVDTPPKVIDGFAYEEHSFLWVVHKIYFQYYSALIFIVCCVVMVIVSYLTAAPDYAKISGLTYGTLTEEHRSASRKSWGAIDLIASLAVLAAIVAAYMYFNG